MSIFDSEPSKITIGMIFGGEDLRMQYLYQSMAAWQMSNHLSPIRLCQKEKDLCGLLDDCNVIIAPTPFSPNQQTIHKTDIPTAKLLENLTAKHFLFCGALKKNAEEILKNRQAAWLDLMQLDEIAVPNAVATAEGLIAEMIRDYPKNIQGSHIVITGYGRCGRAIAQRLRLLSANVTILLRKHSKSMAYAWSDGFCVFPLENLSGLSDCDILINSVPTPIINSETLCKLSPALVYEIASAPGGFTEDVLESQPAFLHHLPGLPGKYAPQTSGILLAKAIQSALENQRNVASPFSCSCNT